MSRQDVQRMMMQNVGLAGHIVAFGAIWRAIADHGGYANVSYDTLSVGFRSGSCYTEAYRGKS